MPDNEVTVDDGDAMYLDALAGGRTAILPTYLGEIARRIRRDRELFVALSAEVERLKELEGIAEKLSRCRCGFVGCVNAKAEYAAYWNAASQLTAKVERLKAADCDAESFTEAEEAAIRSLMETQELNRIQTLRQALRLYQQHVYRLRDMECPVPCDVCGELIPLDKAHFYTDYCDCRGDGCTHGVCDLCLAELDEEDED